jgi:hypothetical protein
LTVIDGSAFIDKLSVALDSAAATAAKSLQHTGWLLSRDFESPMNSAVDSRYPFEDFVTRKLAFKP